MSRNKGIRPSPKYGVNPSLQVCFFCGKEKGIAFLGKLKGDVQAPRHMITDYEPCSDCAEKFKQGILWIEVTDVPAHSDMLEIAKGLWPTGRYTVTTDAILNAMTGTEEIKSKRKALVPKVIFDAIIASSKRN